jgi:hypothetical protein
MTKHYSLMEVRFEWSHYVYRRFPMKHCIKSNNLGWTLEFVEIPFRLHNSDSLGKETKNSS